MKDIRYFWTENGKLTPLDENDKLIQNVKWHKDETLKVEIWPFDLKIGPCTQIPYGTRRQTKRDWVKEVLRNTEQYRREKEERSNQESLIRLDEARSPYSAEFTKRDDARNRAYLSKKVPKGREDSEEPSSQTETPF